ncbi:MAG: hypothetical protein A3H92_03440 [Rhodospirillales bacterium RIFCSPLOWO2_02_FULL_58_16]|nr:MAG: hypothetical protein A3H92_03440 [Rhodospirillales bacterium RIFCSPLOWO2_02_FULL_58_16]
MPEWGWLLPRLERYPTKWNHLRSIWSDNALSRRASTDGHIGATFQQTGHGYVFIKVVPVQTISTSADVITQTLFGGCVQQAGEPSQRDADGATV